MKIIETPWEQRNLGVASSAVFEIEETDDKMLTVNNLIENRNFEYQEVRVPGAHSKIINDLVRGGFDFIETMFTLWLQLEKDFIPLSNACIKDCDYHKASLNELDYICNSCVKGNIFLTDKIALNAHFGPRVAGKRYSNWIRDAVSNGTSFAYIYTYKEKPLGFFIIKELDLKKGDGMIGALFEPNIDKGMGYIGAYYSIYEGKNRGYKKIRTCVSSNNPKSLELDLKLGYRLKEVSYTLSRINVVKSEFTI